MSDKLPPPLVAADVDLSDYKDMPIEVVRLRRSKQWLLCKRRPELAFYVMNLWLASWLELPTGSLEDDDDVLCDAAMCDPKRWPKVRDQVLRNWIKCSDGRLYHETVAEKATKAWETKRNQQSRTQRARDAVAAKRRQQQDELPLLDGAATKTVTPVVTTPVTPSVTDTETANVTGSNRREEKGIEENPPLAPPRGASSGEPVFSDAFLAFWAAYPHEEGDPQMPAWGGWNRAVMQKMVPPQTITAAAERYAEASRKPGARKVAHAKTWLDEQRWNDWKPVVVEPEKPFTYEPMFSERTTSEIHRSHWRCAAETLHRQIGAALFKSWLAPCQIDIDEVKHLIIRAPTKFHGDHVRNNFDQAITAAWGPRFEIDLIDNLDIPKFLQRPKKVDAETEAE